jgi:hypothetical protein
VFQVTITTARGLFQRTEHRHVHGDQLWIVLDPQPHLEAQEGPSSRLPGRMMRLEWRPDPREEFRRTWRSNCRAG